MTFSLRQRARRAGLALLASLAVGAGVAVPAAPAAAGGTTTTCAQVVAIAVRGTDEAAGTGTGPFGNTYTTGGLGTPAAVTAELKMTSSLQIRSAGLIYHASWDNAVSLADGPSHLLDELNALASNCPNTRTVLVGYSQGAAVIAYTLTFYKVVMSTTVRNNLAAVVFFGDPGYRQGELFNDPHNTSDGYGIRYRGPGELDWVASRLHSYCYEGDTVCDGPYTGNWTVHNNAYDAGQPVQLATQFILNRLNYSGGGDDGSPSGGGSTPVPTLSDGVILQEIAQAGGYTGPVDGIPGVNTWLGTQQVMTGYGYTGPIDGAPGTNTYAAMQRLAQQGGYTGPVDGALGVNSWKGLQTVLSRFGYTGPVDGVPGTNTYAALQRLAKLGGYTGPADGVLGTNSWKGVQKVLSGYGYTGPIDGAPGPNTYAAMQRMAQLGGYTGPVDGALGPNTWTALARLI
ncbi:cutinase family protein [Catellatospora chokoriensis]|uniref:Peptidoglycan binding-like domain-containing protein n=1 Tax=Catellatospora chokoriensis TaxID=310353 RepID=A0A8J3NUL6_9ACTN|nr:cutinase family protein [Catellatospora chokoriensis]GIF93013.1 hypothetical protein Cch02nite_64570 [Catellatospora chokoriensis]